MSEASNQADRTPLPEGVFCPDCGYDLRGSTSERCSECGFALEELRRAESQIPWTYRDKFGTLRAYLRTVGFVLRQPRRFYYEAARPVSYGDCQSFRWLTLAVVCVPLAVSGALLCIVGLVRGWWTADGPWWLLGGFLLWSLLALATLPGLASYFFQPRHATVERQNRAIALSYYAWAPLAITPLALVFWAAAWVLFPQPAITLSFPVLVILAGAVYVVALVITERRLYGLWRRVLNLSAAASVTRLIVLHVLALLLLLLLLIIPAALFWLAVVVCSFT